MKIKYLVICIILMTLNGYVHAEWVEVGFSEERSFRMYYDPASIKKSGDIATVQVLKNYRAPQKSVDPNKPYTFLSTITHQEIKCSENKARPLSIEMWSKLNGSGIMEQSHDYAGKKEWGRRYKITSIINGVISRSCK
jgi:hypothetical protein